MTAHLNVLAPGVACMPLPGPRIPGLGPLAKTRFLQNEFASGTSDCSRGLTFMNRTQSDKNRRPKRAERQKEKIAADSINNHERTAKTNRSPHTENALIDHRFRADCMSRNS